jgi:hypothetical protein
MPSVCMCSRAKTMWALLGSAGEKEVVAGEEGMMVCCDGVNKKGECQKSRHAFWFLIMRCCRAFVQVDGQ